MTPFAVSCNYVVPVSVYFPQTGAQGLFLLFTFARLPPWAHYIRGPELWELHVLHDEGLAGASLCILSSSFPPSLSNSPTEDWADPVLWDLLESGG